MSSNTIIIMADDLQAMLSTIGQKFDMSFDEGEQDVEEEGKNQHHKSINPENRIETPSPIETLLNQHPQSPKDQSNQPLQIAFKDKEEALAMKSGENLQVQVPFLPLLEKEEREPAEGECLSDKAGQQGETGEQEFSCVEEEMEYYRSLSEKFEDALNKAHSRKSISTCYQGEFMERQEHFQRKKQTGLTQLLQEKERRERGHHRGKPLINSYSQQILPHHTPIDKRYPAVLAERRRKVEAWQAERERAAEQARLQQEREIEKWNQAARERVGEVRSTAEYFETQQRWSERRYKNIEENGKKQDQSLRAEASFRPKINQRSDNMMKKKPERVPVYEKQPQFKKLPNDPHCTFKPNLSKTLKRIA